MIYVCDEFSPVEAEASTLLALAERDPLRLFEEYVRPFVEDCVGGVEGVEVKGFLFFPEVGLVVGYVARHRHGEACILPKPGDGPDSVGRDAA
nr:hypothetical protein [Pyrobaculum arsenaticum]